VELADVTVAFWEPENVTKLFAGYGLKPVPDMVTIVPITPLVGVKLVIVAGNAIKLLLEQPVA